MTAQAVSLRKRVRRWRLIDALAAGAAAALMVVALVWLTAADQGLIHEQVDLQQAPVTVFRPADGQGAPVVVIAHGFSGSRQMMQPFATTLARNGYVTVSFDFPGHGANPKPLAGEIGEAQRTEVLLDALTAVVDFASALPEYDGRLALLGHSMAGDIAARYADRANANAATDATGSGQAAPGVTAGTAIADPDDDVDALVAVSPYLSQEIGRHQAGAPENLLFIYGEWEPQMIHEQGRNAVAEVTELGPSEIEAEVTYGRHDDGSARRLVIADNVEHIGVLYSPESLDATLNWLNEVFSHRGSGWIDARGAWLGLYFLGVILLAWPLSRLLPRVASEPLGAGLDWRRLLPAALLPALLTPLLLRPIPSDFLAIAIADYIALHFALYALLTAVALAVLGKRRTARQTSISGAAFAIALVAVVAYLTLAIAVPTDLYVAAFLPDPHRFPILLVILITTLFWFSIDEWLTRGPGAFGGGYALTKVMFLVSLMLAVVLNLEELFFLVIIIPAILILFIVFGLFSGWIYRRTGHPLIAGLANALAFATAITVSFPIAD